MKIGLVINNGFMTTALTGIIDVLQMANNTAQGMGHQAQLTWQLIGVNELTVTSGQGFRFECQATLATCAHLDTIIFLGFQQTDENNLLAQSSLMAEQLPHLVRLLLKTQYVLAGCNAVAVLAKLGLLDGKQVTSSWWLDAFFARHCPRVQIDSDQSLVIDGKFITSGTTLSFLALACHMVELTFDAQVAEKVSRYLLIERQPIVQSRYKLLSALPAHHDKQLKQIERHIIENLTAPLALPSLACIANVSERTLIRKFKNNLGMTPKKFIQQARIERCCQLLQQTDKTNDQIALAVGYQNTQALQKLFQTRQGQSMNAYRRSALGS